jgi:hypothetical protein
MVSENADEVDRFVRASIKGWQYALDNRAQIADRIYNELPRHIIQYQDIHSYNRTFARLINDYLAYPYVQLGHNNQTRWYRMIDQLRSNGTIEGDWDETTLFRSESPVASFEGVIPAILLSLVLILALVLFLVRAPKCLSDSFVLILVANMMAEQLLESSFRSSQFNNLRLDATRQLSSISAKLNGAINRNLSITGGLAAHIGSNPDIDQLEFEHYAKTISLHQPLLDILAAAPDLVIKMIYPLEPNRGHWVLIIVRMPRKERQFCRLKIVPIPYSQGR